MPGLSARAEILEKEIKALGKRIGSNKGEPDREDMTRQMTSLKGKQEKVKERLVAPCLITADATKEALAHLLAAGKNEALSSISSEARGAVDVLCGRYNKMTDESIYTSAWSGDSTTVHRRGSPPVHLLRPCLAVLWLFQPDKLEMLLSNDSMTSSGLLPRFLLFNTHAQPQHETSDRPGIDAAASHRWRELIADLATTFHQADAPAKICTQPQIKATFRAYKNEIVTHRLPGGDLADVNAYAARWCENAWRLALVLHAAERGKEAGKSGISQETADNAIKLMRWFAAQQLQILSASREDKKSARLIALVDMLGSKPDRASTLRDLRDRNKYDEHEIRALAAENPDKLVIEKIYPGGAGRPKVVVRLA